MADATHSTSNADAFARLAHADPVSLAIALQAVWGAMRPKARERALGVLQGLSLRTSDVDMTAAVVSLRQVRLSKARDQALDPAEKARRWRRATDLRLITQALS